LFGSSAGKEAIMARDHDKTDRDRPNTIPWPPILYVVVPLIAYIMHRVWPLAPIIAEPPARMIGWLFILSGVGFGIAGIVRFRRLGTAIEPTSPATVLATSGIYARTRNPMYLGAVLALLGVATAAEWTWLLVLSLILPFLLWHLAIKREEAHLERTFGAAYEAYRGRVRRWL
jgi:protein-S-isoprenylcysteine O-methyltransferase Ste14